MFENEIKFISDFTLNKVKELGSFITVEKLLATDIHPSIKKYVEGEIDYLIFEDRKKLIENSLFDYSGKEISNYFDLIGSEIKKTKKISYEDIKNIILQAVSFNANYVVRPKWSLSKLIYGNSKTVSINEIQLMFNYTYYYEYLNSVFLAYLAKKKILNVSVTEFELIMNKIDRELFMLHQSKLVDNALYGMADYFSIGGLNKSSVSVEAVETFLKEKNLTELLFKLKRNYANSGKKKVDIDEVRKVLYSTLSIDSPFVEETETEDLTVNEKHFENPLKDSFITEELTETELQQEPEVNEEVVNPQIEAQVEDVPEPAKNTEPEFVEEIQSVLDNTENIINSIEAAENEQVETDIEKAIEQIEPAKFDLDINVKEDEIIVPDEIVVQDDFIVVSKDLEIEQVMDESAADEDKELIIEKPKEERTISEEEFLTSLTEEIEKSSEEEIIILDEKEQEDLLNFYDNELEISIDDDLPSPDKKVDENTLDISLDSKIEALEFEHELPETSFLDDGVPIDKIDFQIDLPTVDSDAEKQNEDSLLKVNIKSKTNDIFSYLTNKEIDKIIKNLFNSDSEDFANTVEKMADCNTYEEATHILDNVFKYARIKPHSKDAKLLSSAVAKYFNMDI